MNEDVKVLCDMVLSHPAVQKALDNYHAGKWADATLRDIGLKAQEVLAQVQNKTQYLHE